MKISMMQNDYLYEFCGGRLNGSLLNYSQIKSKNFIEGFSEDLTEKRNAGSLCQRKELDNQPLIKNYLGPMYGGDCYIVNGKIKRSYNCTDEEKCNKQIHIIRYESQEFYNMMCD